MRPIGGSCDRDVRRGVRNLFRNRVRSLLVLTLLAVMVSSFLASWRWRRLPRMRGPTSVETANQVPTIRSLSAHSHRARTLGLLRANSVTPSDKLMAH